MRSKQKGSALIMVILVVLVLTMIGLAAALYMNMENRVSQNDKLSQAAFHAAQAGLKVGEQVFNGVSASQLDKILDPNTFSNKASDEPQSPADLTAAAHLGTVLYSSGAIAGGVPLLNQAVAPAALSPVGAQEQFSLFVRNDPNDHPSTDPNYYTDHNGIITLVSKGMVVDATGGVAAVKIVAEQIVFSLSGTPLTSYRSGQWGASSTLYQ